MSPVRTYLLGRLRRFLRRADGTSTVEFVIVFPLVFGLLLTSIDLSVMTLRQIFLDRALDIALREVRLGRVPADGIDGFKRLICANAALNPDCEATIAIELRPVTAAELASLDPRARCIDRAAQIAPVLAFDPGRGDGGLMLVRACTVSNPFIVANGILAGRPRGPNDDFMSVSIGIFVNEPAT